MIDKEHIVQTSGFTSENDLEDVLTQPSADLISASRQGSGDIAILGAGGKMGPTLAVLARRALDMAGRSRDRVYAVSRFADTTVSSRLRDAGVDVLPFDLMAEDDFAALPDASQVIFMVGAKFGASQNASWAWAINAALPDRVARRYRTTPIVALSTGNVYPFVTAGSGGAREITPPDPIGEYAQSCLGRERIFQFAANERGTPIAIIRLNYAVDLRYGVLADLGRAVFDREPVSVATGNVNVVWQGYANDVILRAAHFASPDVFTLNLAGPETLGVEAVARRFGELFDVDIEIVGEPEPTALLSDSRKCMALFGYPPVPADTLISWQAEWIAAGLPLSGKPTKWAVRDGRF